MLGMSAMTRGGGAGSAYTPAHLENGQIVPGHLDDRNH
jgi:hypothetical protein